MRRLGGSAATALLDTQVKRGEKSAWEKGAKQLLEPQRGGAGWDILDERGGERARGREGYVLKLGALVQSEWGGLGRGS